MGMAAFGLHQRDREYSSSQASEELLYEYDRITVWTDERHLTGLLLSKWIWCSTITLARYSYESNRDLLSSPTIGFASLSPGAHH